MCTVYPVVHRGYHRSFLPCENLHCPVKFKAATGANNVPDLFDLFSLLVWSHEIVSELPLMRYDTIRSCVFNVQ